MTLAPIVFSWLAGRGAATTRVNTDDAASDSELESNLETVLQDSRLFAEQLVWLIKQLTLRNLGLLDNPVPRFNVW